MLRSVHVRLTSVKLLNILLCILPGSASCCIHNKIITFTLRLCTPTNRYRTTTTTTPRLFTSLYVQCAKVKLVLKTHAQLLQGKVSHNLQGSILDLHSVLILCLLCSLHFDNIKLHNLTKGMYIYCSLS